MTSSTSTSPATQVPFQQAPLHALQQRKHDPVHHFKGALCVEAV
eukprot:CAMPEP_0171672578 /NCGR_PEP_ID=MMETSP0990-20121206/52072_1 /TAXON_ID=483369 /ORGANISM="non described non described, Strain CCMP2098" /LENGTH=43 /DNA_ID= /DNA_START= /DNA_END= /DNA_ORIENTATION=